MGKRKQTKTLGNVKVDLSEHTENDGSIPVTYVFSGAKKKKGGVSKTPSLVVCFSIHDIPIF